MVPTFPVAMAWPVDHHATGVQIPVASFCARCVFGINVDDMEAVCTSVTHAQLPHGVRCVLRFTIDASSPPEWHKPQNTGILGNCDL